MRINPSQWVPLFSSGDGCSDGILLVTFLLLLTKFARSKFERAKYGHAVVDHMDVIHTEK
jgi:hypothetical protein